MLLSKNFTLEELLASNTATRDKIAEQFTPPTKVIQNLQSLCINTLQPVRDFIGVAITDSSGYRCEALNKAVGGEPTSQHLTGKAADINAAGIDPEDLFTRIMNSGIKFDQLIIEHDSKGNRWVHISFDPDKAEQRGECLRGTKIDGGYTKAVLIGYGAFKRA